MAKRKGQHKSDKEQYTAYKATSRREVNRKARLERHMKKHPNDVQTGAQVGKPSTFRSKPNVKGNFEPQKSKIHDPVTGQILSNPSFFGWDDPEYDPIPPKKRTKRGK